MLNKPAIAPKELDRLFFAEFLLMHDKKEIMAHMLAKLRHVTYAAIKEILRSDAEFHARQGIYLEQLWQNADDSDEVLFLFRVDNLKNAREFIHEVHGKALRDDPNANLPMITFLDIPRQD